MAVKTFNPAGSADNWSSASAWGGSAPADGDSFVIAAGKTCYMNVDQSGMTIGMVAGTVNGTLRGPNGAGLGYLKMDGVAGHDITIASGGSLIHGTQASPAAANSIFKISLGAASEIYAAGNDRTVQLWPTVKTYRVVRLTAQTNSGSSVITVDRTNAELQADGWQVGDYICVSRPATTSTPQQQLFTISAWGGGSAITLSGTLAADAIIGCYVANHSSNIMILTARAAGSTECAINCSYSCPVIDVACNIVNTNCVSNATNMGGYGLSAYQNTLGRGNLSYTCHGANIAGNYSRGANYAGCVITACNAATSRPSRAIVDIVALSCTNAIFQATDVYCPSTTVLFGCVYTIANGAGRNMFFDGTIRGCLIGTLGCDCELGQNAVIGGSAAIDRNHQCDISLEDGGVVIGQGTMLQSSVPVYGYKTFKCNDNAKAYAAMYNYASSVGSPQYGRHWFWSMGGKFEPTSDAGFTALGYSVCHKMTFEWSANKTFFEIPVEITAGQPFYMAIDIQLGSGGYTFVENPSVILADPGKPFESGTEVIASAVKADGSSIDITSTSIQRLYISYVPPVTSAFPYGTKRQVYLRVRGKGGNSGGTSTDFMLLAWSQAQSVVADVQSLGGSAAALTKLISDADGAFKPADALGTGVWAGVTGADALKAAWGQGAGNWRIELGPPPRFVVLAPDNATVLHSFVLDSANNPSSRSRS